MAELQAPTSNWTLKAAPARPELWRGPLDLLCCFQNVRLGERSIEDCLMNAVEIEEAISALAEQPFDPEQFP